MKTRIVSAVLVAVMMLMLAAGALADYSYLDCYYSDYPYYKVESYNPNGYCYLYDRPSSVSGVNLGRHENGELVKVLFHDASGWYYVVCSNGKQGYMHDYVLTPYTNTVQRDGCIVCSTDPYGYCYMYDAPSSSTGRNLGRYENGEVLEVVDWNASERYARVYSPRTGKYGYVRKSCLSY